MRLCYKPSANTAEQDPQVKAQAAAALSRKDLQMCQQLQCPKVNTMWLAKNQPQGCMVTLEIENRMPFAQTTLPNESEDKRRSYLTQITAQPYQRQIPVGCPRRYDRAIGKK